jgi:hypothetical protein
MPSSPKTRLCLHSAGDGQQPERWARRKYRTTRISSATFPKLDSCIQYLSNLLLLLGQLTHPACFGGWPSCASYFQAHSALPQTSSRKRNSYGFQPSQYAEACKSFTCTASHVHRRNQRIPRSLKQVLNTVHRGGNCIKGLARLHPISPCLSRTGPKPKEVTRVEPWTKCVSHLWKGWLSEHIARCILRQLPECLAASQAGSLIASESYKRSASNQARSRTPGP